VKKIHKIFQVRGS